MQYIHFRVIDGWIYIGLKRKETSATYFELYRMGMNSAEMTMINPKDDLFSDYSIDDDGWIYYVTAGEYEGKKGLQLWRMHHDGTEKQQLMQEVGWAIDYSNGEIYFSDKVDNNIYAISFFGTEKRKVVEGEWTIRFVKVIGDWVYYVDTFCEKPGFYKVKKDGSELTLISQFSWPSYNRMVVRDNWLTYRSEDLKHYEMVRISDMYDTDELLELIFEDQVESALRSLDMEDNADRTMAETYKNYKVRKYE